MGSTPSFVSPQFPPSSAVQRPKFPSVPGPLPPTTRVVTRNGIACVALRGELDFASAPDLSDLMISLSTSRAAEEIIVDLRDVTFLDCSTLHVLHEGRVRAQAAGRRFAVVGAIPRVRRVFELTRTESLYEGEDPAGALARFTRGPDGPDAPAVAAATSEPEVDAGA